MTKFNFEEVKKKAVRLADKHLEQGLEEIENGEGVVAVAQQQTERAAEPHGEKAAAKDDPKDAEPTKGVQTYITVSMYRRLSDIKLNRGETIGNLVAEAVALWLDVQEGKAKVSEVI